MTYKERYKIENADAFEKSYFLRNLIRAILSTFLIIAIITGMFAVSFVDTLTKQSMAILIATSLVGTLTLILLNALHDTNG